jgi:TATA-binding protein-associated factor Taf7
MLWFYTPPNQVHLPFPLLLQKTTKVKSHCATKTVLTREHVKMIRGSRTQPQTAPRGTFIGRGGVRRPNLSLSDGDDEQDNSGSSMFDQDDDLLRRTYDHAISPPRYGDGEDEDDDDDEENEDEYEDEEEEDEQEVPFICEILPVYPLSVHVCFKRVTFGKDY